MSHFHISAFADEASPALEGQLDALRRNGFTRIEPRNIDGRSVVDFSDDELAELSRVLKAHGVSVPSIGSPIGKTKLDDATHFARFERAVKAAHVLEASRIRMFSFYVSSEEADAVREQIIEQLQRYVAYAAERGIMLCHENEKGIYGETAPRCLDLMKSVDGLRAIFDPANSIQADENPREAYSIVAPYVEYLHIKDALSADHTVVPAGEGDGQLSAIIDAYKGTILTLEPHLSNFIGLAALQDEALKHKSYATPDEAFDAAADALKLLLNRGGHTYE